MITKPGLPPIPGYVEVDVWGVRKYKNIQTGEILGEETTPTVYERVTTLEENSATKDDVQAVWDSMAAAYTEGVNMA